jgi:hypothetical protein
VFAGSVPPQMVVNLYYLLLRITNIGGITVVGLGRCFDMVWFMGDIIVGDVES